jgi:S-adenosylmethionine:tRNA ribosyltransferase-isomerase
MAFPEIDLSKYGYHLPSEKIADFPLELRDHSRLLHYQKGKISDKYFYNMPEILPKNSLLVFNNTKVIQARLFFERDTGAQIEILLDKPIEPSRDPLLCLDQTESCTWECIIGNKKKWKDDEALNGVLKTGDREILIEARITDRAKNRVTFTWKGGLSFAEILENTGHTPLPPYIRRDDTQLDKESYQTVYAKKEGAVAAPTAGLHFTNSVINDLRAQGTAMDELTLHVGAGTFKPIKDDDVRKHDMHSERMYIRRENIESILNHNGPLIPVGTTAMRSLESLFWFGYRLETESPESFIVSKDLAFESKTEIDKNHALENILRWMEKQQISQFSGETSIFIVPGYQFRICNGIVTNFHQPGTTLILLIAALIGDDWKKVYQHALENDYRFLSYGDSSLLIP